jgi:hypothetical protein
MIIYIRKSDGLMCRIIAEDTEWLVLRNDDVLRASFDDWRVTHAEFARLYEPCAERVSNSPLGAAPPQEAGVIRANENKESDNESWIR